MLNIQSAEVREKIAVWESELRSIVDDKSVRLVPVQDRGPKLTLDEIVEIVCYVTDVSEAELTGKNRKREIMIARQLISYFGYRPYVTTWKMIGQRLGGRDHTTAINEYRALQNLLDTGNEDTIALTTKVQHYILEVQNRRRDQN